ncbi:MAG: hypothetical protein AAF514_03600, partial [Verrucomicrobiota bacterium]
GWRKVAYDLPAGRGRLQWRFEKDGDSAGGQDAVWLDQFDYTPFRYNAWRTLNFGGSPAGGPDQDPDRDGLVNLFEYAFDSNPLRENGEPLLAGSPEFPDGFLRFVKDPRKTDLRLELETSLDMKTWQGIATFVMAENEGLETHGVNLTATADQRFFRLRVALVE